MERVAFTDGLECCEKSTRGDLLDDDDRNRPSRLHGIGNRNFFDFKFVLHFVETALFRTQ